jgi:DNA-directed RNA polymerase subunit N (RpoN/RPB10)
MSLYPVLCFQCEQTIDDKIRTARALVTPERGLDRVIKEVYPDLDVCCIEKILCCVETIERQVIGSAPKIKPAIAAMKFRVPAAAAAPAS